MITRGSKKGLVATDLGAEASATLAAKVAAAQVVEGVPTTSKYRSNLVVGHCKCFCLILIYQNDILDVTFFCLSVLSHSGISL